MRFQIEVAGSGTDAGCSRRRAYVPMRRTSVIAIARRPARRRSARTPSLATSSAAAGSSCSCERSETVPPRERFSPMGRDLGPGEEGDRASRQRRNSERRSVPHNAFPSWSAPSPNHEGVSSREMLAQSKKAVKSLRLIARFARLHAWPPGRSANRWAPLDVKRRAASAALDRLRARQTTVSRCARRQESGGRPRRMSSASATVCRPISRARRTSRRRGAATAQALDLARRLVEGRGLVRENVGRGAETAALDLAQEFREVDHGGPAHQQQDRARRDQLEFALSQEPLVLAGHARENDDDLARPQAPRRATRRRRRSRP